VVKAAKVSPDLGLQVQGGQSGEGLARPWSSSTSRQQARCLSDRAFLVILNIVPSLDTAVCATSTRKFNEAAGKLANTVVLVVSADLPFASKRFRTIEGLQNVVPLSLMRGKNFAEDYGVLIEDGPLAGISARAVVVLDENDRVVYRQLVPEIGQEPDYDKALAAVR